MYNSYNYPHGADTPDAPWNDVELPEREFEVNIAQTIERQTTVWTNRYDYEADYDEDGGYEAVSTDNTDWEAVLKERRVHTPIELIHILKELLIGGAVYINERETQRLIEECSEYREVDTEIEEC